jgi:peptidoglycan/xylan/chitin deacetylase (PgdA/CDA1 family)
MAQENSSGSLKHAVRQGVKKLAVHGGALSLFHRLKHREVLTVLMFHRVLPGELIAPYAADDEYTISVALLEGLMRFSQQHYNIVSLDQVLKSRRKETPLPSRPLLVTFDDGWNDNVVYAAPLLAAANIPWTLFAATDAVSSGARWWQETLLERMRTGEASYEELSAAALAVSDNPKMALPADPSLALLLLYGSLPPEKRDNLLARQRGTSRRGMEQDMAGWDAIAGLQARGVGIGGHGASHLPLTMIADPLGDLEGARDIMRQRLGDKACTSMSFPHGRYSPTIVEGARKLGMQLLFTSDPLLNACPGGWLQSDLIGRISMTTEAVADAGGTLDAERVMPWLMLR